MSTGSVGMIPLLCIKDIPVPSRCACTRDAGARLSAGGLLNKVEYHCLLPRVEPIPCLREPNTALGPERL